MRLLPNTVEVIDPPAIIAEALKNKLSELNLLSEGGDRTNRFQVSDLTENFRLGAQRFFGSDIDLEEVLLS
jgi:glutamate racemase